MKEIFYTGIGSRETPSFVLELMEEFATNLEKRDYILRSGGAEGADQAFSRGAGDTDFKDIYVPWSGFAPKEDSENEVELDDLDPKIIEEALLIVKKVHPSFKSLNATTVKFHIRNVFQVLGDDLKTPSEFLVCYATPTKKGVEGGTNTAYQVALLNDIPAYNLFVMDELIEFKKNHIKRIKKRKK